MIWKGQRQFTDGSFAARNIYCHGSAVSAQLWPPKIFTRAPLMVIYKKRFPRYATSLGRMALKIF